MNPALPRLTSAHRGGLLGVVASLHGGLLLIALAAAKVAPPRLDMPLIVDLIAPPALETPPAAPPRAEPKPRPAPDKASSRTPAPKPSPAVPAVEPSPVVTPGPTAPVAPPTNQSPAQHAEAATKSATPAAPAQEAVSQARFDADYLKNPAPGYPPLSRRMGEEGRVVLRVSVTPQGTADAVEVRASSGSERLDEAARKTVRAWRFIPARRGEIPVQSWVLVPIVFKLEQ